MLKTDYEQGYDDCMNGRSPKYCSSNTSYGSNYLQGWQDANAEKIRLTFTR